MVMSNLTNKVTCELGLKGSGGASYVVSEESVLEPRKVKRPSVGELAGHI